MEPESRVTQTHVERDRRSGSGMAFIIGGLVVAVAVIALVVWGGDFGGGSDVDLSTQGQVPVVAGTPADVDVRVESQTITPAAPAETAPAAIPAPAASEPAAPAAPAQQ